MFRALLLLLVMGVSGFSTWAAQIAPRVALVVGVSACKHVTPLANTLNDAQGLAAAPTRIGFDVETVTDPDRTALEAAARRFGKRATGADAALFFYAGHALEFSGQNWLVPVQAEVHNERDLRFETVQIEGQARVSILVLDSCRDNPFRKTLTAGGRGLGGERGLAPQRATVGTLIVYATAPAGPLAGPLAPASPAPPATIPPPSAILEAELRTALFMLGVLAVDGGHGACARPRHRSPPADGAGGVYWTVPARHVALAARNRTAGAGLSHSGRWKGHRGAPAWRAPRRERRQENHRRGRARCSGAVQRGPGRARSVFPVRQRPEGDFPGAAHGGGAVRGNRNNIAPAEKSVKPGWGRGPRRRPG